MQADLSLRPQRMYHLLLRKRAQRDVSPVAGFLAGFICPLICPFMIMRVLLYIFSNEYSIVQCRAAPCLIRKLSPSFFLQEKRGIDTPIDGFCLSLYPYVQDVVLSVRGRHNPFPLSGKMVPHFFGSREIRSNSFISLLLPKCGAGRLIEFENSIEFFFFQNSRKKEVSL